MMNSTTTFESNCKEFLKGLPEWLVSEWYRWQFHGKCVTEEIREDLNSFSSKDRALSEYGKHLREQGFHDKLADADEIRLGILQMLEGAIGLVNEHGNGALPAVQELATELKFELGNADPERLLASAINEIETVRRTLVFENARSPDDLPVVDLENQEITFNGKVYIGIDYDALRVFERLVRDYPAPVAVSREFPDDDIRPSRIIKRLISDLSTRPLGQLLNSSPGKGVSLELPEQA
jgi:hypothetical protein